MLLPAHEQEKRARSSQSRPLEQSTEGGKVSNIQIVGGQVDGVVETLQAEIRALEVGCDHHEISRRLEQVDMSLYDGSWVVEVLNEAYGHHHVEGFPLGVDGVTVEHIAVNNMVRIDSVLLEHGARKITVL